MTGETPEAQVLRLHAVQKWCLKSEDARRLDAMLRQAKSLPGVPALPEDLNADPWLLNCPNGTLDLRSCELRPHRREDLITTLCPTPYHPGEGCPLWQATVETILGGDMALVAYLQRLLGYCLTGSTREAILPVWWGDGANGKTLLLETMLAVLGGDYATPAPDDLLMLHRGDTHPTCTATLFGKRLVTASETQEDGRLNEAVVKKLTGGDKLQARGMRENYWDFTPTHKIVLATNHKPPVRGGDHAIWRRLRLLPFRVRFWDPDKGESGPPGLRADKGLKGRLVAQELPGILAWCVRGTHDWLEGGMREPPEVRLATAEYQAEEDALARWLAERCCRLPEARTSGNALYVDYKRWHEAAGEPGQPHSRRKFGSLLQAHGFHAYKSNTVFYLGISLAEDGPTA